MSNGSANHDRRRPGRLGRLVAAVHSDRGAAAVSFLLCLPIFMMIIAILVQYALIVNAKVMVDRAAQVAGRAAVTCLPDEKRSQVFSATYMALVPLSPVARVPADSDGIAIWEGMRSMGMDVGDDFAARYTYARDATTISWTPGNIDHLRKSGQDTQVKVTYRFRLTVPGAMAVLGNMAKQDTVAGVNGGFFDIISTARVQTSHGRQAQSNNEGWPG